jgi:hypothetical protein
MCFLAEINYIALFLTSLTGMAIGFLWYSDFLFVKQWMQLANISPGENEKNDMMASALKGFIVTLICSLLIAKIFHYTNKSLQDAASILLFITFFFGLNVGERIIWEKMPLKLFAINMGHKIVSWFTMLAVYSFLADAF